MTTIRNMILEAVMSEAIQTNRDKVDNLLDREMKRHGIHGVKVNRKIMATIYTIGKWKIVSDGQGIEVHKNGKEVRYFGSPMLDYKKAVEMVQE